jgi:hypothetical protein
MPNLTERQRAYWYRLALGFLAVLVLAGIVSGDDLPVWADLVAAALGLGSAGLATANTSTSG